MATINHYWMYCTNHQSCTVINQLLSFTTIIRHYWNHHSLASHSAAGCWAGRLLEHSRVSSTNIQGSGQGPQLGTAGVVPRVRRSYSTICWTFLVLNKNTSRSLLHSFRRGFQCFLALVPCLMAGLNSILWISPILWGRTPKNAWKPIPSTPKIPQVYLGQWPCNFLEHMISWRLWQLVTYWVRNRKLRRQAILDPTQRPALSRGPGSPVPWSRRLKRSITTVSVSIDSLLYYI